MNRKCMHVVGTSEMFKSRKFKVMVLIYSLM